MENLELLKKCEHCENEFELEKLTLIDGKYYCEDCINELFTMCEHCGDYVLNDDADFVDGDYLCNNCLDELATYCEFCDEWHYSDNVHETNDGHFICNDCLNDSDIYRVCNDCGTVFNIESEGIYDNNGNFVCGNCADGNYFFCDGCEEYYRYDESDAHDAEDCTYCDNCYEEYEDNNDGDELNNYSYKPELKIFTTGHEKDNDLYCGFELETEQGSSSTSRDTMCKLLNKEINNGETFIYFKTDGSLNYGIEVVSHAFSWEYYKENKQKLEKMLKLLSENGYRSHDTSTCGLHVHINKKFFGNTTEEQNTNIDKLILFFEYFKDQIKIFSRRNDFHYCNFLSDKKGITDKKAICNLEKIKNIKYSTDRYVTVNIENANTVEIRVFKGTLKPESFFASLEFVFNVARVVKDNGLDKITFSKVVNYVGSEYIRNYCIDRNIKYNYEHLKDYSIECLRNKQKLERQADKLLKQIYNLPVKLIPHAKKYIDTVQKDIENKLKNKKMVSSLYGEDSIEQMTEAYRILKNCYLLCDCKREDANENNYYSLRNARSYLTDIASCINNKTIFENCVAEFLENVSRANALIDSLRAYKD